MTAETTAHIGPWLGGAATLIYGVVTYILFLVVFLYAVAFLEGAEITVGSVDLVPRTIDRGGPVAPVWWAIIVDLLQLALFAVQHSVMARQGFKRWWTRFVPVALERSTYVLLASVCLALLMWLWHPITLSVWNITVPWVRTILVTFSLLGWLIVLLSTFLISHTDLFGLRQVMAAAQARAAQPSRFATPLLYRLVRHPLYFGFLIAFWATPTMTLGHLIFSIASTGYILVGIQFEERDLVRAFGESYWAYRQRVPMLVPFARRPGGQD